MCSVELPGQECLYVFEVLISCTYSRFNYIYSKYLYPDIMLPNSRAVEMNKVHIYLIQMLFVAGVSYGSQNVDLQNRHTWLALIARYVIYFLLIRGSQEACALVHGALNTKQLPDVSKLVEECTQYTMVFIAAVATVYYHNVDRLFGEEFLILFFAYLIVKYLESEKKSSTISYGCGMACSFFEGYLVHIMPNDGAHFGGFVEKIRTYEDAHGVDFPVKKLFLIITKNLYCPPDLKDFNVSNREDIARIEACQSMEEVSKDVAGVKSRKYQSSAYQIRRAGRPPVYVAAECATPLHTLYRALHNAALHQMLANIDLEEILTDFSTTLDTIVNGNPAFEGKLVIVYFDNTDKSLNLADVLLNKIREIEPDFENIILKRREERRI